MKLQAFIDDSAADSGDRRLFLCGYANTADKWADFSADWQKALNEHPKIEYFKMSEAFSFSGPFSGWQKDERDKKVALFASLIKKCDPISISCSVSRKDYMDIVSPVAPNLIGNPYFPCFHMITIGMARLSQAANYNIPVDYIFDEQGQLGTDVVMFYEYTKNNQSPEIQNMMGGTPAFGNDRNMLPIQAADMLAWHIRREHEFPKGDAIFSADHIMGGTHAAFELDQNTMKKWAKEFALFPGVGLTQSKKNWSKLKKEITRIKSMGVDPSKIKWPIKARVLYWLRKIRSGVF